MKGNTLTAKTLFLVILSLLFQGFVIGQENLYLGSGTVFTVDTAANFTVIGNVLNEANGGSITIRANSTFRFYGTSWTNNNAASITGNGQIQFIQPQVAPYSGNVRQTIDGSGSNVYFQNIYINNSNDVGIINTATNISDTLRFVNGKIILTNQDLILGTTNEGTILGYDQNKYVVTDYNQDSGYLIHRNSGNSARTSVFPIGYSSSHYTPFTLRNNGTADHYKGRVFLNVYENGKTGTLMNSESVGHTWDVRESTLGGGNINLTFQHNSATEGARYIAQRNNHYVSHYEGKTGLNSGDTISGTGWDLLNYSNTGSGSTPGTITTGTSISNAVMTNRNAFTDTPGYFTKTIYRVEPLPIEIIDLQAIWAKNIANVIWTTTAEWNNKKFEIERSSDAQLFVKVGEVFTQAPHGNSSSPLLYTFVDSAVRKETGGNYYYRLKQIDQSQNFAYTPWVKLNSEDAFSINAFPNPNHGKFFFQAKLPKNHTAHLNIYDANGKIIYHKIIFGGNSVAESIQLGNIAPGIYQLSVETKTEAKVFKLFVD